MPRYEKKDEKIIFSSLCLLKQIDKILLIRVSDYLLYNLSFAYNHLPFYKVGVLCCDMKKKDEQF